MTVDVMNDASSDCTESTVVGYCVVTICRTMQFRLSERGALPKSDGDGDVQHRLKPWEHMPQVQRLFVS